MQTTFIFVIMNMLSGMGYSALPPLFPSLGIQKGLTETVIGFIIGIFDIANILTTSVLPYLTTKFKRIHLLYFATFCEATCTVIYGIIGYFFSSYYLLLITMIITRIIHGCCNGIVATLVYSLTISLTEESKLKKALGNLEISWCIGVSASPVIDSIFFNIGGYPLPFLFLGLLLFISGYLSYLLSSEKTESNNESEECASFTMFLKHEEILIILGAFIFGMISETFFYPSLTTHLEQNYGLPVKIGSLFFSILSFVYIIALQFLDVTTQKFGLYGTSFIGLIMAALGVYMIFPYYPFPQKIISVIMGLTLIGGGGAPLFIPGLISISNQIKEFETEVDELSLNDACSAIYDITLALGDFLGPIIGGYFSTNYGFKYGCLIVSIAVFLYSLFFLFYFRKQIINKSTKIVINEKTDEKELINHPGFYKESNNDYSIPSNLNSETVEKRKKCFSSVKKDENNIDFSYSKLNDI